MARQTGPGQTARTHLMQAHQRPAHGEIPAMPGQAPLPVHREVPVMPGQFPLMPEGTGMEAAMKEPEVRAMKTAGVLPRPAMDPPALPVPQNPVQAP